MADEKGDELVPRALRITEYRVVETSTVTDEALTRILNEETSAGWVFDGMTFVPNEASKRPKMAFVIFTRERIDETVQ